MPENTQTGTYPMGGVYSDQLFVFYDAGKPEYVRELAKRFGTQFDPFNNWLRYLGRDETITGNGAYHQYEENRKNQTIKVYAEASSSGVNTDCVIQLDPTWINATTKGFFGRKGEVVTIPGTDVQARIMSVSGAGTTNVYFTLHPVSVTADIGTLHAGDELAITNYGQASGMGMPGSVVSGVTKRTFYSQILTEQAICEGAEITKGLWYQAFDSAGQPVGVTTNMMNDALYRYNVKLNGAMLLGQDTGSNPSMFEETRYGANNEIRMMKGLDPTITSLGKTNVIAPTTFDVEDLDDFGLYMNTQGVDSNIVMMAVGDELRRDIENGCKDYLQGNGTDFIKTALRKLAGNDNYDMALALGFAEIYKGSYHYLLKTITDFSDPKGLGATGYDFRNRGYVIPLSTIRDAKSGEMVYNISTKSVSNNGYDRKLEVWTTAGAGGQKTTKYVHEYDDLAFNIRGHRSIQFMGVNQWQKIAAS